MRRVNSQKPRRTVMIKVLCSILLLVCFDIGSGRAETMTIKVGPNTPLTSSQDGSGASWTSPDNIFADDSTFADTAISDIGDTQTQLLVGTNFGFSIEPTGGVFGVQVDIDKQNTNTGIGEVQDLSVVLTLAGSSDKAQSVDWPASEQVISYGGITDIWGLISISGTQINSSTFGAKISGQLTSGTDATPEIDYIAITIWWIGGSLIAPLLDAANQAANMRVLQDRSRTSTPVGYPRTRIQPIPVSGITPVFCQTRTSRVIRPMTLSS